MIFKCLVLLFCLSATIAQKGGRKPEASNSIQSVSPVRAWARKGIQPDETQKIEQITQQEEDTEPAEDDPKPIVAPPPAPRPLPALPRPVAIQPPRIVRVEDPGHPAPEPYSVSWAVDDPETGAKTGRSETQDASGEVVGFYYIIDAEGRNRRVDYTAGRDGFRASIASNEEGQDITGETGSPADVNLRVSPPVREQPTGPIAQQQVIRYQQPVVRIQAPVLEAQQPARLIQSYPSLVPSYLPSAYRSIFKKA